jgi:succinate-acetate transporter protein
MDGWGQMGRLEEKNRSSTFVLTAFISFGLFNIFHEIG